MKQRKGFTAGPCKETRWLMDWKAPSFLKGFCKALLKDRWGDIAGYLISLCIILCLADGEAVEWCLRGEHSLYVPGGLGLCAHSSPLIPPWGGAREVHICKTTQEICIKLCCYFLCTFSSVQSLSSVWFFANPRISARQASLSITNLLKLLSIESVMPSNHLILCHPLLLLPSVFPSIRFFFDKSALCIR